MGRVNFASRTGLKSIKKTTGSHQLGVRTFCFAGQVVVLKEIPQVTKKFVPKKKLWRDMLKKTPPKSMKPKKVKKRRESMKEVVLRIERVIRVATRDMLEDYCKEFAREGVPKKNKPRKIKSKVHEGVHCPAMPLGGMSVGFKESPRPCTINVTLARWESYDTDFTLGSFGNAWHPGIRVQFTARLDYNDPIDETMLAMPEKVFDEDTVELSISVSGEYDSSMEDEC